MVGINEIFALIYIACLVAVVIYSLVLATRFVNAQEKMAASLDVIARKLKDDSKP